MEENRDETVTRLVLLANRLFRYHVVAFVLGNLALWGLNRLTSENWWAFWPLMFWSLALALHFFLVRSFNMDDDWAEARAERLRAKSYDRDHINRIQDSYEAGTMPGRHDLNRPPEEREKR